MQSWSQSQHSPEPEAAPCLPPETPDKLSSSTVHLCFAQSPQPEGNREEQNPQINAVLTNKSLWHRENPKEPFPSCLDRGPAGVPGSAACTPKSSWRARAGGSCGSSSFPAGWGQRWTQLPQMPPPDQPHKLWGCGSCSPGRGMEQLWYPNIWAPGFPDRDSGTHPQTAEPWGGVFQKVPLARFNWQLSLAVE